ncbi:MAG: hypothetical protein H6651_18320 [Ardenticatenales bacterium]|nr:hypothetical protein [Ardenticatenales bacterium]
MSSIDQKLGFWSATLAAITFIIFTVCFVVIAVSAPPFVWSGLADYLELATSTNQFWQELARAMMLLFGPLYVVMINALYERTAPPKQGLARLALLFALGFAILTGANYFIQLSTVRISLAHGETGDLLQIVQANPYGAIAALNLLGWSLFLGLSSLFAAGLFRGDRLSRWLRALFLINGLSCLLGGAGYLLDHFWLLFLSLNLGMGGAMTASTILLARYFRRHDS